MRLVLVLLPCTAMCLMGVIVGAQEPSVLEESSDLLEPGALQDQWGIEQSNQTTVLASGHPELMLIFICIVQLR